MKTVAVMAVLVVVGIFGWGIANRLSADALGMGVGLVFGVLAGVPTSLLVLTAGRRSRDEEDEAINQVPRRQLAEHTYGYPPYPQPPPIIVVTGAAAPQYPAAATVDSTGYPVRPALPGPVTGTAPGQRTFKVVGEKEEWLEEW